MKVIETFETIDEHKRLWIIEEINSGNNPGLTPKLLYDYINNSEGDEHQISRILNIPVGLIRAIKK